MPRVTDAPEIDLLGDVPHRPIDESDTSRIALDDLDDDTAADGESADEPKKRGRPRKPRKDIGTRRSTIDRAADPVVERISTPLVAVPDELVDAVYHGMSGVLALLAERWYPMVPGDRRSELVRFSESDLRMLRPSTGKILAKYGASWLTKYGDEFALVVALTTVIGGKVQSLRSAASTPAPSPRMYTAAPIGAGPGGVHES